MICTHRVNPIAELRFLVALPRTRDLLFFAKHLFFAAMVALPLLRRGGHLYRCSLSWVGAGQVWAVTFVAPIKTKTAASPPMRDLSFRAKNLCVPATR
jgi:hypothetical protein